MKSASILSLLAGAVLIGCSGDGPVAVDAELAVLTAHQTAMMVPFKGNHLALTDPNPVGTCPDGQRFGRSTVTDGNATHLGRFTGEARSCIIGLHFESASLTWVGANGDQVWLNLDSDADQIVVINFPVLTVTTVFDVTGGTGRFDGATGRVTVDTRVVVGHTAPNESTWEGTISSPGSIKVKP